MYWNVARTHDLHQLVSKDLCDFGQDYPKSSHRSLSHQAVLSMQLF